MIRQAGLEDDPLCAFEMYSTEVCLEHITVIGASASKTPVAMYCYHGYFVLRNKDTACVQWLVNFWIKPRIWVQFVLMYDKVLYELDHSTGELVV